MNPAGDESSEPERRPGRTRTVLLCALLLLAGAAAILVIFSTEPVAQRETAVRQTAMLVDVTTAEAGSFHPVIRTMGTVRPAREVTLSPRVGGQVVERSAALVPGGFVRAGEVVVRIDDADYRNALEQRESELQQALADLDIEQGRQDLAERDYRELDKLLPADKKALVLREPHLRAAQARIRSARAAVEQARLDVQRTVVTAPFDAQVLSRDVEVGSQVDAGQPLARLTGIKTYWVETTVPPDRLSWLEFADGDSAAGSPVTIRHRTAWPAGQTRQGRLFRLIGALEDETRLARALIVVEDPLAQRAGSADAPRLMLGTYVECLLQGRLIEDVLRLPRDLVRTGDTVWVMRDGALAIQPVDIVFRDADYAYIRGGLTASDRVVTSSLATIEEGVPLRLEATSES